MSKYKLVPSRNDLIQCLLATRGQSEGTTADSILSMLAAAPTVQGEPVGWESIDGLPHDPDEGELFWFARSDGYVEGPRRIQPCGYDYDEFEFFRPAEPPALYTAPQPAEQQTAPDVSALVAALESLLRHAEKLGRKSAVYDRARAALAAHRKGGGEGMSGKCAFVALPSADAFSGLLCTACGETFEKEPICPKQGRRAMTTNKPEEEEQ